MDKIQQLKSEIDRHNSAYYQLGKPSIADSEYDKLKRQYESLSQSPLDVGDDRLSGFSKHAHRGPMLSLDNVYNAEELHDFVNRQADELDTAPQLCIEPKIDGLAISLTFKRGKLTVAATRGNKTEGDDVTRTLLCACPSLKVELAQTTNPVAESLRNDPCIELRGEVYVTFAEFERINDERRQAGLELFANPRNLASGTLKTLDLAEARSRRLNVVLYGLGFASEAQLDQHHDIHTAIKAWGLPGLESYQVVTGYAETLSAVNLLDQTRKGFAYPTDGAVIKLCDLRLQEQMGVTSRSPRWATAYKYAPEQAETRLNAIEIQIGRTGVATPVARLAPVLLSGSTVANATLHNIDEIARKDIRVNDTVVIEKAGEIIPAVISVVTDKRPADSVAWVMPTFCPSCRGRLTRKDGEAAYRCTNSLYCRDQVHGRLVWFASKPCLDIDGLGTSIVEQLIDLKLAATPAQLFALTKVQLMTLDKFGEKSADNLLASISAAKKQPAWRVLCALGVPGVGVSTAKDLLRAFSSIGKIAAADMSMLTAIDGIGETTAKSINDFFSNEDNCNAVIDLAAHGLNTKSDEVVSSAKFSGMTFVFTGVLTTMTRPHAQSLVEANGGKAAGSVSKKTTIVVAGDAAGSKLTKAQDLGIKIIDEETFLSMVG